MRDHRGIIFASLDTIIKNKMGDIFLSGQNQCNITGVKKSYFCHAFHLRPKKVSWWVVWKVTLVSVCVHFLKLLDKQTEMDTELDKNSSDFQPYYLLKSWGQKNIFLPRSLCEKVSTAIIKLMSRDLDSECNFCLRQDISVTFSNCLEHLAIILKI